MLNFEFLKTLDPIVSVEMRVNGGDLNIYYDGIIVAWINCNNGTLNLAEVNEMNRARLENKGIRFNGIHLTTKK
jgi:hypothetical protein